MKRERRNFFLKISLGFTYFFGATTDKQKDFFKIPALKKERGIIVPLIASSCFHQKSCFRKLVMSKFTGQKVIIVFETIFWRL